MVIILAIPRRRVKLRTTAQTAKLSPPRALPRATGKMPSRRAAASCIVEVGWFTIVPLDFRMTNLHAYCLDLAQRARAAARHLATATGERKNRWLLRAAADLETRTPEILEANARDLAAPAAAELTAAQQDRLRLTPERIRAAAAGLREVAVLPDPVGRLLDGGVRPNGLEVHKVAVPLGVIFFIYESRPNVTVDAAGLCVKSGNALVLRGGKEALQSNTALHGILQDALRANDLPADAVQLVETPDRNAV